MKIYGSEICSGCREFKALMNERGLTIDFIEITQDTASLRAFLQLRDSSSVFDSVRAEGRIGIPAFVNDDGEITLDPNTALAWIGQPPMEDTDEPRCASCM